MQGGKSSENGTIGRKRVTSVYVFECVLKLKQGSSGTNRVWEKGESFLQRSRSRRWKLRESLKFVSVSKQGALLTIIWKKSPNLFRDEGIAARGAAETSLRVMLPPGRNRGENLHK